MVISRARLEGVCVPAFRGVTSRDRRTRPGAHTGPRAHPRQNAGRVGAILGAITATGRELRRPAADLSLNHRADLHLSAALGGLLRTAFWKPPYSPAFRTTFHTLFASGPKLSSLQERLCYSGALWG